MTFIPVSKLRSESTGALMYVEPKGVWKGIKQSLQYGEADTASVVLTLAGKDGGVVKCRADISDIMFDDELPHCSLEGEDKVYFVIHLKTRTYWAYYDFAYASLPREMKQDVEHQSWVIYEDGTALHEHIERLAAFLSVA